MKSLQSELSQLPSLHPALVPAATPQAFKAQAKAHPLWHHPFVERCRTGTLSLAEVRVLAAQMYKFCHAFPRFLATALASCDDDAARQVIGENLWDELGEGRPEDAHPALFRRFTRALGYTDEQLHDVPALPQTQALIDTYLGMSQRFGLAGILGALCYASEGIVAALYTHIQHGLRQALTLDDDALMFFTVHIHIDDGHADQLEAVLHPMLKVPFHALAIEQALQEAMDARCRFFDGVMAAAQQATA
ncbi:MAG TPA: iron-containing redox enzyme family protein [Rhizobacter sp.]|nr:iron-containing redox enzyme family protein [Rhizobacter sp.]